MRVCGSVWECSRISGFALALRMFPLTKMYSGSSLMYLWRQFVVNVNCCNGCSKYSGMSLNWRTQSSLPQCWCCFLIQFGETSIPQFPGHSTDLFLFPWRWIHSSSSMSPCLPSLLPYVIHTLRVTILTFRLSSVVSMCVRERGGWEAMEFREICKVREWI